MVKALFLSVLCCVGLNAGAQDRPTMGWSSWNTFGLNINEDIIKGQADAMVASGLSDAGYRYINIDDGFFGGRRMADGQLLIHPVRFPNGLKGLVSYIHGKGLKAGIYSDAGRSTCGNFWGKDTIAHDVGLYGHDRQDADFYFKTLGFDFIKVDFCGGTDWTNFNKTVLDEKERYTAISNAIRATGRKDVILNVCRWDYPGTWVSNVAQSWRTTHDIADNWPSVADIIQQNLYLSAYSSPGHYNDMDMLEVGRSLSDDEDATHFGLWCMMNSPLLIGSDLRTLKPATLTLLKNEELIALNQDPLSQQAYVVARENGCYVLVKDLLKLNGKTRAFAVYNPTEQPRTVTVDFASLDLDGKVTLRNLLERRNLGTHTCAFTVELPPHGTRIYRATAQRRLMRTVYEGECGYISSYQELTNHQAAMTGTYEEAPECHGGAKATWLGGSAENDLVWHNVYVPKAGRYHILVHYQYDKEAAFTVDVNGKEQAHLGTVATCNGHVATASLTVHLNKGRNRVRLHNDSQRMPDIDCMTLKPL